MRLRKAGEQIAGLDRHLERVWPQRPLRDRQQRLFSRVQLHIEGGEQGRGPGVVTHQHHELDELGRPEQRLGLGEGFRRHLVVAEDLPPELDGFSL